MFETSRVSEKRHLGACQTTKFISNSDTYSELIIMQENALLSEKKKKLTQLAKIFHDKFQPCSHIYLNTSHS